MAQCAAARHVYLDLGVNWCNTLQLHHFLPEVVHHPSRLRAPWLVFGFEASPLIAPYAELCTRELTAGRPLPPPPIIPSGSTRELRQFETSLNCSAATHSVGKRARSAVLQSCAFKALKDKLQLLKPDASLSSNVTGMEWRLEQARTCPRTSQYILIPGAAGACDALPGSFTCPGSISMFGGAEQMIRGGLQPRWRKHMTSKNEQQKVEMHNVLQVDLVGWMLKSFREEDFVVLKMDIEGFEHIIVPRILKLNATKLIDVALWECHFTSGSKCHELGKQLMDNGLPILYAEPFPFEEELHDSLTNVSRVKSRSNHSGTVLKREADGNISITSIVHGVVK
eukprot:CAMPEP_0195637562 /NCGR_PEP_ID=MMETSP0815-20121206/24497_1 /TAXON_ID=97485 /ORGANISM="Prymnesium parvum, Strain Texoma1" /LENGTH=338 /DNA_ID=CAMNT_0040779803 /DNA_START=27 /DNA_END=1043 /DNA_ORIENTATION=+